MTPDVSVVVPTFNRRERLLGLLDRLAVQTLAPGRFEVIVVVDGATDGTAGAARARAADLPYRLEVDDAPHAGPAAARNRGWRAARARVVAFTDDDVLPGPAWLEAGLARLVAEPLAGGVEGLTEPELGADSRFRMNLANLTGGLYPTCNMFYRRSTLEAMGGFDEGFSRYSDDSDLAFRVLDSGLAIPFEARARVVHRSHLASLATPLAIASQLPDNLYLEARHPHRPRLRPPLYRADAAALLLAAAAGLSLATAHPFAAAAALAAECALAARAMSREVVFPRLTGPGQLAILAGVYLALPFANLYHLGRGMAKVRRAGLRFLRRGATRPAAAGERSQARRHHPERSRSRSGAHRRRAR